MTDVRDEDSDGFRSYQLAIRAAREQAIRRGQIKPDASKPHEVRWSVEGVCDSSKLEAVRDK